MTTWSSPCCTTCPRLELCLPLPPALGSGQEDVERVRQVARLIEHLESGLQQLVLRVRLLDTHLHLHTCCRGKESVFPLVEALGRLARTGAPGLEALTLDLDLGTQHLALLAGALARCQHLTVLRLPRCCHVLVLYINPVQSQGNLRCTRVQTAPNAPED